MGWLMQIRETTHHCDVPAVPPDVAIQSEWACDECETIWVVQYLDGDKILGMSGRHADKRPPRVSEEN